MHYFVGKSTLSQLSYDSDCCVSQNFVFIDWLVWSMQLNHFASMNLWTIDAECMCVCQGRQSYFGRPDAARLQSTHHPVSQSFWLRCLHLLSRQRRWFQLPQCLARRRMYVTLLSAAVISLIHLSRWNHGQLFHTNMSQSAAVARTWCI